MKYPEGDEVRAGDVIWTNGGCHIRRVQWVLSAAQARVMGIEDGSGVMWVRNINPHGPTDVRGFEAETDFAYEGIGKLTRDELQHVEDLFHGLEARLEEKIWHRPGAVYYPVFSRVRDRFRWFLFYSASRESREQCYEFRDEDGQFELIDDEELRRRIRVL